MFEKFNIEPKATCLTDSYDISLELIKKSQYWGLTPEILLDTKNFKVIRPTKGWHAPYNLSMIWRKNKYSPNFYDDFLHVLKGMIYSL